MKPLTLTIGPGGRPDHGFDEPLGLLSDCHRRIEHFLNSIASVTRLVRGGHLDDSHRQALQQALAYFATAAPRHTADEEISLFPRLRACEDGAAQQAVQTLDALESDHREAERLHALVDGLVRRWISSDGLSPEETEQLLAHLDVLTAAYTRHIHVEDHDLFPAAARALSPAEIEKVGREMAARRGVPFEPPAGLRR